MAITDFTAFADTPVSPARSLRAVTPDDYEDLPDGVAKSLYVLTDGNLEIVAQSDEVEDAVTIPVVAGMLIPVMVKRVMAATTATVVALY